MSDPIRKSCRTTVCLRDGTEVPVIAVVELGSEILVDLYRIEDGQAVNVATVPTIELQTIMEEMQPGHFEKGGILSGGDVPRS